MRHLLLTVPALTAIALSVGCASGGGSVTPAVALPDEPAPPPPAPELDTSALATASAALQDGRLADATHLVDSLYVDWAGSTGLDPGSARDLAELLDAVGAEDRAAHLLLGAPFELDDESRERLRVLVEQLSLAELEVLRVGDGAGAPARSVLTAELAVNLAWAGRLEEAERTASETLSREIDAEIDGPDRRKVERVLAGEVTPLADTVLLGVVLPGTGRFAAVGEQILEGALLAVQEYRHAGIGPHIELYVRDDSSNIESTLRNVEELETMGVIAVLGPILTEALMATALRRTDDALLLLSPTATEGLGLPLNAYTLWDRSRREVDVASALATWMSEQLELRSFGVLRPDGGARDVVAAVREAVETAGGEILGVEAYAPDSTTFEGPITALAAVEPDAVIVLADRARTVLQIAPQLVYYGLRRWVTGGDAHWSDPAVVRRLDASYADFRLVATYLDRVTPDSAWRSFETAYEAEYRKALANSMFTPLGYDGMRLLLSRLAEPGAGRRGVLGRALRRGGTFRGATGALSVDPGTGELRRDVIVRVLRNGELRVPDRAELLEWAADQRELEDFLKALEEEEEDPEDAGKEETP